MTLRHTVSYERFDVVKVPFPFIDKAQTKKRPALILSTNAAFNVPSVVRMKLFTLDHRFVLGKIGRLDASDEAAVTRAPGKLCG